MTTRKHTSTIERSFATYMSYQIKDPNWRMSQNQIDSLAEPRAILKKRGQNKTITPKKSVELANK